MLYDIDTTEPNFSPVSHNVHIFPSPPFDGVETMLLVIGPGLMLGAVVSLPSHSLYKVSYQLAMMMMMTW